MKKTVLSCLLLSFIPNSQPSNLDKSTPAVQTDPVKQPNISDERLQPHIIADHNMEAFAPMPCDSSDLFKNPVAGLVANIEQPQVNIYQKTVNMIDQYVYKPFLTRFAETNIVKMDIDKIYGVLTEKIDIIMEEFIKVGKEAKALQLDKAPKAEINEKHEELANLFQSMRSAEIVVRSMYPRMNNLFDQLISLREDLDYTIEDLKISTKKGKTGILQKLLGK